MICQPLPAATFSVIKLRKKMEPAALLAESLSQPGGDDRGSFGVKLAHLVATVVVLGLGQISIASLGLAPRGVRRGRRTLLCGARPTVKSVHEVILGGRKISTPSKVESNS